MYPYIYLPAPPLFPAFLSFLRVTTKDLKPCSVQPGVCVPIGPSLAFQLGGHRHHYVREEALGGSLASSWATNFSVWVLKTLATARVTVLGRRILSLGGTVFVLLGGAVFRFSKLPCVSHSGKHTSNPCYAWASGCLLGTVVLGNTLFFWGTHPFCFRHAPCYVSVSHLVFIIEFRKLPIPYLVGH